MNDPIKILLEEHKLLLKAIETTKKIQQTEHNEEYHNTLHDMILFFRNFSEVYHHPKEENILYPLLKNRSENMSAEFIFEICDNHEDFKSYIADIENAYIENDYKQLRRLVSEYLTEFEEHIRKENRIILHVAKQLLSQSELNEIHHAFVSLDTKNGDKETLINNLYRISIETE